MSVTTPYLPTASTLPTPQNQLPAANLLQQLLQQQWQMVAQTRPAPDRFQPASRLSSVQGAIPVQPLPLNQTAAVKRFAVIGDAGTGKDGQFDIAQAMETAFENKPFASVLVLGDNVYPNGDPALFDKAIRQPYEPLSKSGVRFYPVLGNHDLSVDGGAAQLRYWGVPRYYSQKLGNTEIFAIDATVFSPNYRGGKYPDASIRWANGQAIQQYAWLKDALEKSTAKYKVVYSHYPLISMKEDTEPPGFVANWRNLLMPLLVKNNVDVYLSGHNHDYEKSTPVKGFHHFVSGAGGRLQSLKDSDSFSPLPYPIEKRVVKRHFMMFEETPQGLNYQVISKNGEVLDNGLIPPKTSNIPGGI